MSAAERTVAEPPPRAPGEGGALPRLLAGIPERGALGLEEHLALHGEPPAVGAGRRRDRGLDLIEQLDRSGLRGRGGGSFPTGAKLHAVRGARGRPVVLVNAAEGEPASFKDRTLLQALPHLVLDGAALAAAALGTEEIAIGVCDTAGDALAGLRGAIEERVRRRLPGAGARIVRVPNRYVAGQESALVNLANGGPALPSFTPPRPFERGVDKRPTLVSNAETFAHVALIARHGPDWFRALGVESQPGSALVTLTGTALAHPGVYEIETGSPLRALLEAAGAERAAQPRAMLVGGYAGTWIDGGLLGGVALSDEHLAPYGATLGAGVLVLLSADACPVAEMMRLTRWLAAQSARQCGPCRFGLDAIAGTVEALARGEAGKHPVRRLESLGQLVRGRGACTHPDGAARLVASALEVFAEELADHARHGPCAGCERPSELPRPRAAAKSTAAKRSARELVEVGAV